MNQHLRQPTTITILGTGLLSERILARLLQKEGYDARLAEANPNGLMNAWLDGADVLLFTPGQEGDGGLTTTSLLRAERSIPDAVSIPLLPLPPTLKLALLDEPAVSVPWQEQFEGLVRQIEAALGRATPAEAEEAV